MSNYSRKGRPSKGRASRIIKLAPTTRAIRAALAVSATMLALSGSGVATAGTCTYSLATNTESCDGAFVSLPGGNFVPVADMTLVIGGNFPTSVTPGSTVAGVTANWGGDVSVISNADIRTVNADGIDAFGSALASVSNYGSVFVATANGPYLSTGIHVDGAYGALVDNAGDVSMTISAGFLTNSADGIFEHSQFGDASVGNSGSISVTAYGGVGTGIDVRTDHGQVTVDNSGSIVVDSYFQTAGILSRSGYGSSIDNSGSIDVTHISSGGDAFGIYAVTSSGANSVNNTGSISAVAAASFGNGTAIEMKSFTGPETVVNAGDISASAHGILVSSYSGNISIDNSGDIASGGSGVSALTYGGEFAFSNSGDITAASSGVDLRGFGSGAMIADNSGDIIATGSAITRGLSGYSGGGLSVNNSGSIRATANNVYGNYSIAFSYGAVLSSTDTEFANSGSIVTIADGSDLATARGVYDFGVSTSISSTADSIIDVTATTHSSTVPEPQAVAIGIDTRNVLSTFDLQGTISASASADPSSGFAAAVGLVVYASNSADVTTVIGSSISADAAGFDPIANGIAAEGNNYLTVNNAGDVDVLATGVNGKVTGLWGFSYGDIAATSSGDVTAEFVGVNGTAYGARMTSTNGVITFVNSGNIVAESGHIAIGATASSSGSLSVANSDVGSIAVTGDDFAMGIVALGQSGAAVSNAGNVTVEGSWAYGICASACYGDASGVSSVVNAATGNINVTAYGQAIGVIAHGDSDVSTDNFGHISVTATVGYATGIEAPSRFGSATVTNGATGSIIVAGGYGATGIGAFGDSNSSVVINSGDLSVSAIYSLRRSYGHVIARGVFMYADHALVDNDGSITVLAANNPNAPYSFSSENVIANGVIIHSLDDALVNNSGSITVTANDSPTNYTQGNAYATGVSVFSYGPGVINSGSITAVANGVGEAAATSVLSANFTGSSDSSTVAMASANLRAYADGIYGAANIDAGGAITATASAAPGGFAIARGVMDYGSDSVHITTHAGSSITADASGTAAFASGLTVIGADYLALDNAGDIDVLATANDGAAFGIQVVNSGVLTASNSGHITAEFAGANGMAYGALVSSSDALTFTNSGDITAINADRAIGVELASESATTLVNSGAITALASNTGGIAVLTGDTVDTIDNSGVINGELWTGAAGDTFANNAGGLWHAIGSSGFGAGDDTVNNAGTIFLDHAAIAMGSSYSGDQFSNAGLIVVLGDSAIDMGTGPASDSSAPASVPSLNPNPFVNDGTISFLDGAPNDTLSIIGDFAGQGAINMDVSALNGASDVLYIDGSVVDGSVSTINVNLIGAPTTPVTEIPVVLVSGGSAAGNFVLGGINFTTDPFLAEEVSLVSHIDTSNATDDVFSLSIDISGLSEPGALAASIAPGVQSLLGSEVGTWRQRIGVIDRPVAGKPGLWARTFQDSGTISPDSVAGNFGPAGSWSFDQRNSGTEAGADLALSDKLNVGVLLAKVNASQQLAGAGVDRLDGDTRGLYVTWISPSGFYLDASYRWMNFDAQLSTALGQRESRGDADALNLELGYAWTFADGWKIEPQFQHTRIKVRNIEQLVIGSSTFRSEDGDSSRDRLGVMFRRSFGNDGPIWTPYGSINVVHESDGKNRYAVDNAFFGATSTEGTSLLVEGGVNVQIGHLSIFGGANWQDGGALRSMSGGQLGLRYDW